ncbi:MAG: TraR/DksA C4-type zinc finger protein [Candidatus Pacebacteria bacterium]|nr:TraR/DksA C4-type zinc finger protein [Candidatus Paceibacterota bacterium]
MKKKFLEEQKEKLLKEKENIKEALSSFAKKDKSLRNNWETKFPQFGNTTSEQDENADEVEEYTNLIPIENRLELKLLDINRALEKIERKNQYGLCEKCGKEIKTERLKMIPETKFCSECARK